MSECSLSASSVSAEDHTRTEVASSSCPASPSGAVFYVYIHVLTFSLHRLYYKKLDGIFNRQRRPSNDPGSSWRTTLRAVTASCVYCATAAALGILSVVSSMSVHRTMLIQNFFLDSAYTPSSSPLIRYPVYLDTCRLLSTSLLY